MKEKRNKNNTKDRREYFLVDNTPYDDVGKTLIMDCPISIIPLINEVFEEHYTGEEEIEFLQEANYVNFNENEMIRGYRDAYIKIKGYETKNYHIEVQSTEDNTMVLRMFEYDIGAALKESILIGNKLVITIARSAVLYLRHNKNTPDTLESEIRTPGGDVSYKVPIIKIKRYTLEEIFQKNLLFLLPFYIFCYEDELEELNQNDKKMEKVKQEFRRIKEHLNKLQMNGEINEREKSILISMTKKVVRNLAAKYKNVKKGVNDIMGGKVLIHEAYVLTEKGRAMERKYTEAERIRADAAEHRANEAEHRANEAELRAEAAEKELQQLKKLLKSKNER